jgi:hypothetical protein
MNQSLQGEIGKGYGVDVLKVQMIRSISLKLRSRFRETPMMVQH